MELLEKYSTLKPLREFLIGGKLSIEPGVELTLDDSVTFYVFDSAIVVKTDTLKYGSAGKVSHARSQNNFVSRYCFMASIEVWVKIAFRRFIHIRRWLMDSPHRSAKIGIRQVTRTEEF